MYRIKQIVNQFLHLIEVKRIKTKDKIVYLTFDDGPEGEITEWVLSILNEYNCKATFFCKGVNVEKNPIMFEKIIKNGHAIGNHTYNHIYSFSTSTKEYVKDVERANRILKTHLFRPPWGSLTLPSYMMLALKYKIIHWSLLSGDAEMDNLELEKNMDFLYQRTRPGDIILFHSCICHEKETKKILPLYLHWLREEGFKCNILK